MDVLSPFLRVAVPVLWLAAAAPAQLTWHRSTEIVSARQGHYGFFDQSRGRVSVVGGQLASVGYGDDLWQLADGTDWVEKAGTVVAPRAYGAMCKDVGSQGRWLMFGGIDDVGTLFADTLQFDPITLAFTPTGSSTSPPPRWLDAMALDAARNRVVMFGGGNAFGPLGDTWEWDGANWALRATSGPSARANHAMAFDAAHARTVLFGGHSGSTLGDTWTWNGTSWTQVFPAVQPLPVHNAMLAYDPARQVVVLFGGKDDAGIVTDTTWEWNGTTWTPRTFAVRPPARELASFTWDELRQRLVLVGGGLQGSVATNDSWTYDGVAWTKIEPLDRGTLVQPGARRDAMLVYDETSNRTTLFGGQVRQGFNWIQLTDTWESAGRVWQQRFPAHHPPASFGGKGTRHRGVGGVVYFPGADSFGTAFTEMWSWNGDDWGSRTLINAGASQFRHQTAASILSSSFGWVFVRRVTTGTGLALNSTVQLVLPSNGLVLPQAIPGSPPATVGASFAQTLDGSEAQRVWLYGGSAPALGGGETFFGDVWELTDVGNGTLQWNVLTPAAGSPVPPPRADAAVTMVPPYLLLNGQPAHGWLVYVAGGRGASGPIADSWAFDVTSRTWSPWLTAPTFSPRYGATATMNSEGFRMTQIVGGPYSWYNPYGYQGGVVVFGGFDGATVRGEIFDSLDTGPATQRTTRDTPGAGNALLVYDRAAQRSILMDDRYRATWSFDGAVWSPFVAAGQTPNLWFAPDYLVDHTRACFDEAHGVTIVHGQWTSVLANGTWTPIASVGPSGASGKRHGGSFVYVPSTQRCVWFSGAEALWGVPIPLGDTWTFDGATNQWTQLTISGPPARYRHAMAVDRLRDRVVLFGGSGGATGTVTLGDTWEYEASLGWQQRFPAHSPPPRANHALVYDEVRGRTVLLGGGLADVWEWDGTDWTQRTPENPTTATADLAVWDAARERIVAVQLSPLTVHEISSRIDTAGPGNTVQPLALRSYSQPALGAPLQLGFDSPLGVAIYSLGIGPVQQPVQLQPPFFCETTNVYSLLLLDTSIGAVQPNLVWNVPNTPAMAGLTVVVQAFVPQAAGCWRATDALHVRF